MKMLAKRLVPEARLPEYAHPGDAGLDVFANESVSLQPGERRAVGTGVAVAIPDGAVGLVWEKSGRALAEGLGTMAGVIDAGYRGEVKVVLINHGDTPVSIAAGEKIAQLLVQPVVRAELEEVTELPSSQRGADGFGSTGITASR
jgi:dUTP pyrophosphatase